MRNALNWSPGVLVIVDTERSATARSIVDTHNTFDIDPVLSNVEPYTGALATERAPVRPGVFKLLNPGCNLLLLDGLIKVFDEVIFLDFRRRSNDAVLVDFGIVSLIFCVCFVQ